MAEMDARKITVFSAEGVQRDVPLSNAPLLLNVGRTPDNDLVLEDQQVSRHHAEIRVERDVVLLTDVGSTNGTFIDGERLAANNPIRLLPGTEVRIGSFVLVLLEPVQEPLAEEVKPGDDIFPTLSENEEPFIPQFPPISEPVKSAVREPLPIFSMPRPDSAISQYLNDLPAPLQESEFLGRFLLLFETVWEPMEWRQDHIAFYFDPRTCPPTFLPYLAQWIGVELAPHWPEARKRRLLCEAAELYRWRGTVYGLARFVELAINVAPTVTENDEKPFTIQIVIPSPPGGGIFTKEDKEAVKRVIERHKPAHVGYYITWS